MLPFIGGIGGIIKKLCRLLVIALVLSMVPISNSFAMDANDTFRSFVSGNYARIINNETGEITVVDIQMDNEIQTYGTDGSCTISGEVTLELPEMNEGISPYSHIGGDKTEQSVKAYVSINYDLRNNGSEIRVNSTNGYWEPLNAHMYVTDREVWLFAGVPMSSLYLEKYPTTNQFSYSASWGYVNKYPSSSLPGAGPRCFTSGVARIYDMSASYTIELMVLI